MRTSPPLAAVLAAALAVTAAAPAAAGRPFGFAPEATQRWEDVMRRTHVPGVAVVLVRDTGIVAMAMLGSRDVAGSRPVTPRTRFYIASCTKPFVAAALWSLAERNALSLDDPVVRWLPRFRLADSASSDSLTIRDLLAHRPGLGSPAIGLASAYTGQLTEARFDHHLARVQSRGRFRYNNLHYQIAGRVLAACAGRPWARAVADFVARPTGMDRVALTAHALYRDGDAAEPAVWRDGAIAPGRPKTDRTLHAAGGMGASAGDLARWLRAHLGHGVVDGRRALPERVVAGMRDLAVSVPDRHPLLANQRRVAWTAGWEVRTLDDDTMFVHTGSYEGASAHMSYVPSRGLGVAVLANGNVPPLTEWIAAEAYDHAAGRPSPDVTQALLAMVERMQAPADADTLRGAPAPPVAHYAGCYANADWGEIEVTARQGQVRARMGDLPLPIAWDSADRVMLDGDTPGRFERDPSGRVRAMIVQFEAPDSVRFERR